MIKYITLLALAAFILGGTVQAGDCGGCKGKGKGNSTETSS
jgi:hypothetical protein